MSDEPTLDGTDHEVWSHEAMRSGYAAAMPGERVLIRMPPARRPDDWVDPLTIACASHRVEAGQRCPGDYAEGWCLPRSTRANAAMLARQAAALNPLTWEDRDALSAAHARAWPRRSGS